MKKSKLIEISLSVIIKSILAFKDSDDTIHQELNIIFTFTTIKKSFYEFITCLHIFAQRFEKKKEVLLNIKH